MMKINGKRYILLCSPRWRRKIVFILHMCKPLLCNNCIIFDNTYYYKINIVKNIITVKINTEANHFDINFSAS